MKRAICMILTLIICLALATGCGSSEKAAASPKAEASAKPSDAPAQKKDAATPAMLAITFTNASDYIFNEFYISPTAANELGDDLLGSTSVLKSNGSINVQIPAYDFDNYDIMVIDEDRDRYIFTRVPLKDGSSVAISFSSNSLIAEVSDKSGKVEATVEGSLESAASAAQEETWIEFYLINSTNIVSFEQVYFMRTGTNSESEMGYNHIESIGSLEEGAAAQIGVDNYELFDILMIDSDQDQWYFQNIRLEAGCDVSIVYNNSAGLEVSDADGTQTTYSGSIY